MLIRFSANAFSRSSASHFWSTSLHPPVHPSPYAEVPRWWENVLHTIRPSCVGSSILINERRHDLSLKEVESSQVISIIVLVIGWCRWRTSRKCSHHHHTTSGTHFFLSITLSIHLGHDYGPFRFLNEIMGTIPIEKRTTRQCQTVLGEIPPPTPWMSLRKLV